MSTIGVDLKGRKKIQGKRKLDKEFLSSGKVEGVVTLREANGFGWEDNVPK